MSGWEYKVVPAPKKGTKGAGVKGPEDRFANALELLMNDMGAQGWEYQRAETLPSVERAGLTGSTTEWRNLLVFRRMVEQAIDAFEPELLPAPDAVAATAVSAAVVADAVALDPAPAPAQEAQSRTFQDADVPAQPPEPAAPEPAAPDVPFKHARAEPPMFTSDDTPVENRRDDIDSAAEVETTVRGFENQTFDDRSDR